MRPRNQGRRCGRPIPARAGQLYRSAPRNLSHLAVTPPRAPPCAGSPPRTLRFRFFNKGESVRIKTQRPRDRCPNATWAGALLLVLALAPASAAQSPPVLQQAVFHGGAGIQSASSVAIVDETVVLGGSANSAILGHLVQYPLPLTPIPLVASVIPTGATTIRGIAPAGINIAAVGGAHPPACGAVDGVGGTEGKAMLALFSASGAFAGCSSTNMFPYTGGEQFYGVTSTLEGGAPVLYAVGGGETSGYGWASYAIYKYDATGSLVMSAQEPRPCHYCVVGHSNFSGAAVLDGFVYAVGRIEPPYPFYDDHHPLMVKFSPLLATTWQVSRALVGDFYGVTGLGGEIYAVGATGSYWGDRTARDFLIEKFAADGTLLWSRVTGWAGAEDVLKGVVAVGDRLFAVGYTRGAGAGAEDAVLLEIDPVTGHALSTTLFGGPLMDVANAVATDGHDLYVAGESRSFASAEGNTYGQPDMMLLHYALNRPPTADAGADQVIEAGAGCAALVTLDGSASSDPDDDALAYTWSGSFGEVAGVAPVVSLAVGVHAITLTVDDGKGGTSTDTMTVTVVDTTPPEVTALSASPAVLWPPNHKMVPVTVAITALDACGTADCRIAHVASSEPANGLGDGDMTPDWQVTGPLTLQLRAERAGMGSGRVYTATLACTDRAGNTATRVVTVTVPKSAK